MGLRRTADGLTPIVHADEKSHVLDEHRDEVLVAVDDRLLAPLERAARRVEEDLCVLEDGRLVAACVCFPSHWRPRDKLGRSITELHAPVPFYADELAPKVEGFVRRMARDARYERRNFTVHERPDRYAPHAPPEPLGVPPEEQWLRSERQTLRRLPRSGAVLFTILTQQVQLRDLTPDQRALLGARLAAEPDVLAAYRGLDGQRAALVSYLRS